MPKYKFLNVVVRFDTGTGVMEIDSRDKDDGLPIEKDLGKQVRDFMAVKDQRRTLHEDGQVFHVFAGYLRVKTSLLDEVTGHDPVFVDTRCP